MLYDEFALVYDQFMDNVPYDLWIKYIRQIWARHQLHPKLVAELACGTGEATTRLSNLGYEMIGIDQSSAMLCVAREKSEDILYLNQDMRSFELYGTVDSVLCLCDSVNYILEEEDLLRCFRLVWNYLNPDGLFIFDVNTAYKCQHILANNTFSRVYHEAAYIWENMYDDKSKLNEYAMTFFTRNLEGLYERFEEIHYQKIYSTEILEKILDQANLLVEAIYDENSFHKPLATSERIFFVARKKLERMD